MKHREVIQMLPTEGSLQNVGLLIPDPEIEANADKIVSGCLMPPKAKLDALHVASAVLAGVKYLLT